jgi:ubiquinone/menaquinone biosynthesis C-methylase UbiE
MSRGKHPLFARFWAFVAPWADRRGMAEVRERSLAHATGRVLEVGAGSGENFVLYPEAVTDVLAVEPEPYLRDKSQTKAAAARPDVTVVEGTAEDLPAGDGEFDTVVASFVLCSVTDPDRVATEMRRVLKPGGRVVLLEHVQAPTTRGRLRRWQERLTPAWRRVFAGCHLNRDTTALLERHGFDTSNVSHFDLPDLPVLRPHIGGYAVRGA